MTVWIRQKGEIKNPGNPGFLQVIKKPLVNGGFFSALIYVYFTPISAGASTVFLLFYIDRLDSA